MILVFTNGCFDLIHPGHIDLLRQARALGDKLIVGINSDASVRAIKGPGRPLLSQGDRADVLRGIRFVDDVIVYDEPTPARLIAELQPDVLVKGGDWPVDQIVGADFVLARGGKVFSLPLKEGYSTTGLIEKMVSPNQHPASRDQHQGTSIQRPASRNQHPALIIAASLEEHLMVLDQLRQTCSDQIERAGTLLIDALRSGHKVLLIGNGGSAADAQHIAAELVNRFETDREPLPAIALTTDTSILTSVGNDFGFDQIFLRQLLALAQPGDVLIAISTSGTSTNIISAVMRARELGCATVGLTGAGGKKLASICDAAVMVPSSRTARIQEAHITIGHIWCEMIDRSA